MTEPRSTVVTLRFFGEALDPDEVTALLGVEPTRSCRKGDLRAVKGGREWRERRGSWRLESEDRTPGDLDRHIEDLLSELPLDLSVWKVLTERFDADVFCGLFMESGNDGSSISPKNLLALGSRGLELNLDIYEPVDDVTPAAEATLRE